MKINNFSKSMIISLICILILPSIAVATTENNSNYNLKIKIKNTKFFYNTSTNYRLSINVSNEGPDFSDNYSVSVVTYRLFSRNSWPWFRLMTDFSYTGSTIEPGGYEKKWYIVLMPVMDGTLHVLLLTPMITIKKIMSLTV